MTSLLTLSDDIRQNETFKEKSGIFARIFSKQCINIHVYFSPNRMLTSDHVAVDCARTSMSCIATRTSSLINYFIFVHCHKQRIVSVYVDRNVH